jgi:hypothetical protein
VTHFWYSEQSEIERYLNFASAMEFGYLSSMDIPHQNICTLELCGEKTEVIYNLCADNLDAYPYILDLQYLGCCEGYGTIKHRTLSIPEIVERMRKLQVPIPAVLFRS